MTSGGVKGRRDRGPDRSAGRGGGSRLKRSRGEAVMFDEMARRLYSPVVSDILDELGYPNHTMNREIRPLRAEMVLSGRAFPIRMAEGKGPVDDPYREMIEAIDRLSPNQVPVLVTSDCRTTAVWGELFTTAAKMRGCRGVIVDGLTRDTKKVLSVGLPVFSVGTSPHDYRGRAKVLSYGEPVYSGSVTIGPGDFVFADVDGAVAVPPEAEEETFRRALEKAGKENTVKRELQQGKLLSEAWKKHHVL